MEIKIEKLEQLKAEADKILITPEGEEVLIQLLELQKQIEDAISDAKFVLEKKALALNPLFTSIQADKVKVYYRSYGARYRLDESIIKDIAKDLYTIKTSYSVIPEAVEDFTLKNKGMPLGVVETERPKTLTFSLKNKDNDETNA